MAVISLKHATKQYPEQRYYFYEGSLLAVNGVVEIPDGFDHWAQRLYKLGFNLDPQTGSYLSWVDVQGLLSAKSTPTPEEPAAPAVEAPVVEETTVPAETAVVNETAPDESAKSEETNEEQAAPEESTPAVSEPAVAVDSDGTPDAVAEDSASPAEPASPAAESDPVS